MKTLMLLRHAKSSWDDPSLRDFDRPLNDRGRRDAPRMGRALAKRIQPDLIVSSPAVRAKQTIEEVAKAAGYACPISFDENIYAASSGELRKLIRALPQKHSTVIMVGHNPSFEDLATRLTGKPVEMPTCTAACISFPVERWEDIEDNATLEWSLRPKEL